MAKKTVPIPILIFVWLAIAGGIFWWWQSKKETKEAIKTPEVIEELGKAALVETAPLKEKDTPGAVIENFYTYLIQEKYREAEKLLTPESLESVRSEGGLEKMMDSPNAVKLDKITVAKEEISGDSAEVWVTFYLSNGEKIEVPEPLSLTKIKGEWKLTQP